MTESTISNCIKWTGSRRYDLCQSTPSQPCAPPASPFFREPNLVQLTMSEVQSPQSPRPMGTHDHPHHSCNRFGVPSQSAFFNRNKPHTQRVHHIKGSHGEPVFWVNDLPLGRQPTLCLGRPLTPEKCRILRGKIPTSAIGTNSNALPINTLTGLQFFPLKQMDTPTLKLLTDAWRDELRDLTGRVGLLTPSKSCRGTSPYRGPLLGRTMEDKKDVKLQLMLIDTLCQILELKSIGEVQQWLLTAGQREKDNIVSLLCSALEKNQPQLSATKKSTLDEEETQACRHLSSGASDEGCTGRITNEDEGKKKRVCSSVSGGRQSAARPPSAHGRLSSPAVCRLMSPQRPVLRYTKRALSAQAPVANSLFQEWWCNYRQQTPVT